jgi:hypothetical protein
VCGGVGAAAGEEAWGGAEGGGAEERAVFAAPAVCAGSGGDACSEERFATMGGMSWMRPKARPSLIDVIWLVRIATSSCAC